jgi:hypothetical protein
MNCYEIISFNFQIKYSHEKLGIAWKETLLRIYSERDLNFLSLATDWVILNGLCPTTTASLASGMIIFPGPI